MGRTAHSQDSRRPGLRWGLGALLALASLSPALATRTDAQVTEETAIKASFLERITRFIDWPPQAPVQDPRRPFTLLIVGESPVFSKNPVGAVLEQVFAEQAIKKKAVKVQYAMRLTEPPGCDLLYLANCRRADLPSVLALVKNRPLLTVADVPGYGEAGVHINFVREGRNLRFEVNPLAIKDSGLVMDTLLLHNAVIVKTKEVRR